MKKKILALVLALAMFASLTACGGEKTPAETNAPAPAESSAPATPDAPADEGVSADAALANQVYVNKNVGLGSYPGTAEPGAITVECSTMSVMNTVKMTYATELAIARHTYDCLVKLDGNNTIVPAAAESWESSEDGMKWTFHLREGAKWVDHTGAVIGDVTAHDFVKAWTELVTASNASEYASFGMVFKNAEKFYNGECTAEELGFKAVDDYTLEVELENYQPYFLQTLKFEVLSPVCSAVYDEVGADVYGTSPETMAYNGAFYMTNWVTDNIITIEKNDAWWDAASVELEKINFVYYTDANAKLNAFQGGEIDIIDVNGEQSGMMAAEGYNVDAFAGGYSFYFYCNTLTEDQIASGDYPDAKLSDARSVNLRKAISYAIDRTQLIATVFKNNNTPSQAFCLGITAIDGRSFGDVVVEANGGPLYPATADAAKAQEYLALALEELGYTDVSQINIALLTSEGSANELFSQVVQEQLRQTLGLEVTIDVVPITEARARRNAKNYDLFSGGWGPDYNDPMTDLELWTTTNSNNHTGYSSEEYDALIEATKTETDPAAREQLFIDAELLLAEDMPIIPTYWRAEEYLTSEKIESGALRLAFQYYNLIYTKLAD